VGHCDASPERISQIHDELLEALAYTGGCELDLIPRSVGEAVRILFKKIHTRCIVSPVKTAHQAGAVIRKSGWSPELCRYCKYRSLLFAP